MRLDIDPDVQAVAQFMQSTMSAGKLVSVAQAVAALASPMTTSIASSLPWRPERWSYFDLSRASKKALVIANESAAASALPPIMWPVLENMGELAMSKLCNAPG
jgi:hypothetical protein